MRVGTRIEYTDVDGDFMSSNTRVRQSYSNLIPNVQATRKWSNTYTTTLSYSLRLQRPYISNLNPFRSNNDSLNVFYGNPNLGPQTIHSLSLQNKLMINKTFVGITMTGSYSGDLITQYASFDRATFVNSTTYDNIGREVQLTMAVNFNTNLTPKWNLGMNGLLRYNSVRTDQANLPQNKGFSGSLFTNTSYKITSKITLSGSGGFMRSPYTLVSLGVFQGFYQVNIARKFLKDKLSATINFNNFFRDNLRYRNVTEDDNFRRVTIFTMPYRAIYFGVTWNFGKLTENVSKKKGVTNDDLLGGSGGQGGN